MFSRFWNLGYTKFLAPFADQCNVCHTKVDTCNNWMLFLVGAFSFKEKSPTITVASFFFRQTTELIAYVPLFTETDKFTQAKFHQCKLTAKGPPFRFLPFLRNLQNRKTPKGPPFQFFFDTVRIFFRKFLIFQKSPPFGFF